mmetsp:Transcript_79512/g.246825  ORF Transcript_79512/g.246825 Transcript_79512/m.246825 type:complete len:291 (-) Transcript_79512:692-1564(-)
MTCSGRSKSARPCAKASLRSIVRPSSKRCVPEAGSKPRIVVGGMVIITRRFISETKDGGDASGRSTTFSPETSRAKKRSHGPHAAPRLRCMVRKTMGTCPSFSVASRVSFTSTMVKPSLRYQEIARALASATLSRMSAAARGEALLRCARRSSKSSLPTPRQECPGMTTTWLTFACGPSSWTPAPTRRACTSDFHSVSLKPLHLQEILPGPVMLSHTAPTRLPSALEAILASRPRPCGASTPEPAIRAKTPSTRSCPFPSLATWKLCRGSPRTLQLPRNCASSAPSVQEM